MAFTSGFPTEVTYPYPEPETPQRTDAKCSLLLRRPAVEDCFCLIHGPTPEAKYMRYIRSKDMRQFGQLQDMRGAMSARACAMLEHPCQDVDAKMNSFHIVDYTKRGHPPACYTSLVPARVCEVGMPIEPLRLALGDGFRHPESFPLRPQNRHLVDKNHPLIGTRTPAYLKHWFSPYIPGQSEYENTISRLGLARMRNTRQYLEPMPSSRLRAGDPNC